MNKYTYIYIPTCAPCKIVSPVIDELIKKGFDVEKLEHRESIERYDFTHTTPCLIVNNSKDIKKPIYIYTKDTLIGAYNLLRFTPDLIRATSLEDFIRALLSRFTNKLLDK